MTSSIFKKVNRDVLIEWIYDNSNIIIEPYKILKDSKNQKTLYVSGDTTITNNNEDNQLFPIDISQRKYSKIDYSKYSYISHNSYGGEITFDKVKIYLPSNFKFGEHQGLYLRAYTYDYRNKKFYDISNFFFDVNDETKIDILSQFTPPILYQDRVWDKFIQIDIPSVYSTSLQRIDGFPIEGSLNDNLTNGEGLSQTSPIFIDFHLISKIQTIGSVKTYLLTEKFSSQFPQVPELESLTLFMDESTSGDYFEIYPLYNNTIQEYSNFISDSLKLNKVYYSEFTITVFEQNVKGKPITLRVEDNFQSPIEFRPIIKYSSSSAIIDVEMKLIDKVSGSIVTKKTAYGMKPDQMSKYSLGLKKINIRDSSKPKIYSKVIKSHHGLDSLGKSPSVENKVKVPVPSLIRITNISCQSSQAVNKISSNRIDNFFLMGKLKIGINPFDNLIKFNLAIKYENSLDPVDLTNCEDIKLVFKNDDSLIEFNQYIDKETSPTNGVCKFKVTQSKFREIKSMIKSGINAFHITTTNQGIRTSIYSGLFTVLDTIDETESNDFANGSSLLTNASSIIDDPTSSGRQETAIVTRKKIKITSKPGAE